jgi:thiol-disulfide isomerase/thioredoxin
MKFCLILLGLFLISSCSVNDFSGYSSLPAEKRKYFVPFSPDSINNQLTYSLEDFKVQELYAKDVAPLTKSSKYTWLVIWAPWCTGMKEIAENYIRYEKSLADKDVTLVFVAVAYGPDGIRKVLSELHYQKPAYVIPYMPGKDGTKIFRTTLNGKFKYRNANHYIFEKDKGLIYTGAIDSMSFKTLQAIIN